MPDAKADPLAWGHGPRRFEIFMEPTCPFSARAFGKIDALLKAAGEDRITVELTLLSQPWHMFSGVVTRAILAASTMEGGRKTARKVLEAVFAHRDDFEFTDHCAGPNMDATPNDILAKIRDTSGVDVREAFTDPTLDKEVKRHTRYARQNGAHVTPTFMVDGIIDPSIGSGDPVESWVEKLNLS